MIEFTGERVVPGEVDADLWNEHLARYEFAAGLAAGRTVLDAGCGTGYGSALLARTAARVTGLDISPDAVQYAAAHYAAPNLAFAAASAHSLPFPDGAFDLIVCYEVIEHIEEWQQLLQECPRVLTPGGILVISTPNRDYYASARNLTGPNPYHVREFNAPEFSAELGSRFAYADLYLQNHVAAIGLQPAGPHCAGIAIAGQPPTAGRPEDAHYLLALCSDSPLPQLPAQLHIPTTANVLRERELHIAMLEAEREQLRLAKQELVEMYRAQKEHLEASNRWAAELDAKLRTAQDRIVALQEELATTIEGFQAQVSVLEQSEREKTEWAQTLDTQLRAKGEELLTCIRHLDAAEATVQERTEWAQRTQAELDAAQHLLSMVRASRWVKLGRTVRLGPELPGA